MKCISVPTSQEAMSRLDFDKCIDGDVIDLNITDEQYRSLVELGLIRLMNDLFDICIDEFEDEKIVALIALLKHGYSSRMISILVRMKLLISYYLK